MNYEPQTKNLFILPGWNGTKQTWQKFADLAGDSFDIEIIELPCFGNEPCPSKVWGVEEYANFVKQKLQKSRIKNQESTILGHSFGGAVATHLVANNPEICTKLILSGAPIFRRKNSVKKIIFGIIAKVGKIIFFLPGLNRFDKILKKILYKTTHSDYNDTSGIKRKIFKRIINEDQGHLLSQIKIPTLVIHGTKDTYVPVNDGKKVAKNIKNAKLEIVKNGKHGLHIQQPENFLSIINNFIKN